VDVSYTTTRDLAAALAECNSGRACAWTSLAYQGAPSVEFASSVVFGASNSKADSVANSGTASRARFYDRADFTGPSITMNNPARGGQTRDPDLRNGIDATRESWANRISSATFV
jgi:hypothetical protein